MLRKQSEARHLMSSQSITPEHIKSVERLFAGLRELVDHPDDVVVRVFPSVYNVIVQLETHPADVSFVVGREGHLIASWRSLLSALAGKNRIRLMLEYKTDEDRNAMRQNRGEFDRSHHRKDESSR